MIRSNIVVHNDDAGIRLPEGVALLNAGMIPTMEYNDIWNNVSPPYVPPSFRSHPRVDVSRDIHVNPVFIDMEAGDYSLHPCSGVVDQAAPTDAPDPDGTRSDIGALPLYQGVYDLSKTLSGDKLTLGNHTYHVTCDVIVSAGDTLTIDPGAQIVFDGPYSITVRGQIKAIGTASQPILFTSGMEDPKRGDWHQIILDGSTPDSRLEYVSIEYGSMERLSKSHPDTLGVLSLIGASPAIRHVTIRESFYTALYCYNGSSPSIDYLEINGTGLDGINCNLNSSPVIKHAVLHNIQGYGIHTLHNSAPQVSNTLIYDTDVVGIVIEDNSSPQFNHITIDGRALTRETSAGFANRGIRASRYCAPMIENSIIANYASVGVLSEVSSTVSLNFDNLFTAFVVDSTQADSLITVRPGPVESSGNVIQTSPVQGTTVFMDPESGDYRVKSGAAKNAASDEGDLGAYGGSNPL